MHPESAFRRAPGTRHRSVSFAPAAGRVRGGTFQHVITTGRGVRGGRLRSTRPAAEPPGEPDRSRPPGLMAVITWAALIAAVFLWGDVLRRLGHMPDDRLPPPPPA